MNIPDFHLKLRRVGIDTYKENVAYLHRDCPIYRAEGFQALAKVQVNSTAMDQQLLAVLNVVNDGCIMAVDELGLSEQAFEQLGLAEGETVCVSHATPPNSLNAVHRKIAGEHLTALDFTGIMQDVVDNRYSRMEMSAFLVACSESGMERDEVLYLTQAMVNTGERLDWGEPLVADKHCIGGIPGNRTTMLVVPIIAAHGMLFRKHPAGPSPHLPARPIRWRHLLMSSSALSACARSCGMSVVVWPGVALHVWHQPMIS